MSDTKWLFQKHDALRNHIECLATFGSTEPKPFYRAIDKALTEARAQGAAEERERLAKDAEGDDDRYPAWVSWDARSLKSKGRPPENLRLADWLRSNTGEG